MSSDFWNFLNDVSLSAFKGSGLLDQF